ncbi:hypothetical protein HYW36_00245, partial [Candidatus Saccharibacteria bacterium]|nr:hypothetical protein [Candidatus Saccharibacteria bacterium]
GAAIQTVNLATGNAAHVIIIGNATAGGAAATTIHAGTGGANLFTTADARTIAIGTGAAANTWNIGTGAAIQTVNMFTGNVANVIIIGNATAGTAAATTIHAGTGGLNLGTTADARTIAIGTGAAIQTVNIATGNVANVITMGDITGAPVGTVRLSGATVTVQGGFNYGVDAQVSDTYVITLAPALTGYVAGQVIVFTVATANTGAATMNVNGLGAAALVKGNDAALANNDVIVNRTYIAVYDGTNFDLIDPTTQ